MHRIALMLSIICISLFYMKITVSVMKSSHQDYGPCYLHLPIFYYTYTLLFCWKIKSCCNLFFPRQIKPQTFIQIYIYICKVVILSTHFQIHFDILSLSIYLFIYICIYYETILVWRLVSTWITKAAHCL